MNTNPDYSKHIIDVKDILKDVEVCLEQGLERKLSSFFDDYAMFQKTHNEVLNLSIVKKMMQLNSGKHKHESAEHVEHSTSNETMYHDSMLMRYKIEIEALKNENQRLNEELEKSIKFMNYYIERENDASDATSSEVNDNQSEEQEEQEEQHEELQ
jgi:hypothetical protein